MRRLFSFVFLLFFGVSLQVGAARAPVAHDYFSSEEQLKNIKAAKPVIILDPGHGGTDEGAKVHAFKEKKITLLTTLLTKKHLEELGYRVILTRGHDTYVSLQRRVDIANQSRGVLFVSIHFNACVSEDAEGIEIFYYPNTSNSRVHASRKLASYVLYHVIDTTEAVSRGVKKGNFHVIRETSMPAVLIEGGFLTHQGERSRLKDRAYLNKLASGIAKGVDRYVKT